jgi:hypothetical protein
VGRAVVGDGFIVGALGVTPAITSVDLALRLLARNADRIAGVAGGRGRKARASAEETDAALIKQLDALARRIAVSEAKRVGGKVVEHGAIEPGGAEPGDVPGQLGAPGPLSE